jgi:hypothetical protein
MRNPFSNAAGDLARALRIAPVRTAEVSLLDEANAAASFDARAFQLHALGTRETLCNGSVAVSALRVVLVLRRSRKNRVG